MQTRQFLNDIQTSLKLISADAYIPARYIFYESQNITADFLKKIQMQRRNFKCWQKVGVKLIV